MAMTSPADTSPEHEPFTLSQMSPEPPRKRKTGVLIAAIIGFVVLAAAGAATAVALTGGSKPASAPASAPTTAAATTAGTGTATVKQYASIVSPSIKDFRKQWEEYQADHCGVRDQYASVPCGLAPTTFDLMAQTLVLRLDGASKLGTPAYIGVPPAEITKLVRDTTIAAGVVAEMVGPDGKPDGGPAALYFAVSRLMTVLDEWDPYL